MAIAIVFLSTKYVQRNKLDPPIIVKNLAEFIDIRSVLWVWSQHNTNKIYEFFRIIMAFWNIERSINNG